ncbi:MAG: LLM class flavin-dependent oxidoreductase [Chloroflexi bacterium]|nr:MAG: LLM class flavin-dependent oxidoreductase [Chloroflexota bacterium]
MQRVEFGWWLPVGPQEWLSRQEFLAGISHGLALIESSFSSFWCIDHLLDPTPLLEGWTTLIYLASTAPHLFFGHAVLSQSFRNPALLAFMAATAQYMSEGRFILGLGAGWKEEEYRAFNYPFPGAGQRVDELGEALAIIRALWSYKSASFSGRFHQIQEAHCDPHPEPLPPLMLGGTGPRMLDLAARYADWWNASWFDLARYRQQIQICEHACATVQRNPATLRRTLFSECVCGPTNEAVRILNVKALPAQGNFIGTPDQIIEQMKPLVELGVDLFILSCGGFPKLTTLELLSTEVLPKLNRIQ